MKLLLDKEEKQELSLGKRDLYLVQLQDEIKHKRNMIVRKKKEFDKNQIVNQYLEGVKDDYSKYYDYIVKEKRQQYDSLMLLKDYIEDLMNTEDSVNNQLRTAKHDQKDVMSEIDKVKAELDELMRGE